MNQQDFHFWNLDCTNGKHIIEQQRIQKPEIRKKKSENKKITKFCGQTVASYWEIKNQEKFPIDSWNQFCKIRKQIFHYLRSVIWKLKSEIRLKSETQNPKPEIRNQTPEIRKQKSEIRSQEPETRNQKSEIRNQKSEIGKQKSEIGNRKSLLLFFFFFFTFASDMDCAKHGKLVNKKSFCKTQCFWNVERALIKINPV